jgi:hypothetical protein
MIGHQKKIIHTTLDLINTIREANYDKNKNYMYEIINTRFTLKLNNIYNDSKLYERLAKVLSNTIYLENKMIKVKGKNYKLLELNINNKVIENKTRYCMSSSVKYTKHIDKDRNLIISINALSNCEDGRFAYFGNLKIMI